MITINSNLRYQFCVDSTAQLVLEILDERLPKKLMSDVRETLRGYTEQIQLEIADDLLDFADRRSQHYTGLKHVDVLLKGWYSIISEELQIKLPVS